MHATSSMSENDNETDGPTPKQHQGSIRGSMKKLILFNNIRVRLLEQLCFLDLVTESHSYLINELTDFFRHRGQLELEHSRSLDKIMHCFQTSHNDLTVKSSKQWPFHTAYACWHQLISETQSLSYDYATLSEIYNINVTFKLQNVLKTYKKYHELIDETHEEILRILRNFYTTINTYNIYQNEFKSAETKLNSIDTDIQRKKVQHQVQKEKLQGVKKHLLTEKQNEILCPSDKLETIKARNIYKHYTEASNVTIHKYMSKDLKDLIYSMDSGFWLMVSRAILAHVASDQKQYQKKVHCFEDPSNAAETMDGVGRNKLSETSYEDFLTRKSLQIQKELNEEKNETYTQNILHLEFELQLQLLKLKEENLRKNLEKIFGILDTVEINSKEQLTNDMNCNQPETKSKSNSTKSTPVNKKEDGKFYIFANLSPVAKQISFKSSSTQKTRSESRIHVPTLFSHSNRTAHAQKSFTGRPKLFGGSLEEYLKMTNEQIPLIMRSCIRAISLFGLHSQGIFRVSGSQVEILNFRDSFERGEDPLASVTDASDMNSVAGVLKLYLRELQEPLFPTKYFDIFLSLIQIDSEYEVVTGMRNFLKNVSKSVVVVIRFLFSFLNHLSEYANENMMDAFNLAVSFGPTLMPAPEDKKQVQYQTQLNELIKILIVYHQEVFPKDLGGPQYDKSIADTMFENESSSHTVDVEQ